MSTSSPNPYDSPRPPHREPDNSGGHLDWLPRMVPVLHAVAGLGLLLFFLAVLGWFALKGTTLGPALDWCFDKYCHRMPQRSLPWQGEVLPVCARCTGVIFGYVVGAILALCGAERRWFWSLPVAVALIGIMGLSWLGGRVDLLPATWHWERVVTGFCGGLGGYIFIARVAVVVLNWMVARSRRAVGQGNA